MNENKTNENQYRATRIWHEIIESFQASIPLKRHWRNFRTYTDCFTASEAVECLYRYLKTSSNFKSKTKITRQQAIQLLQVFLNEKIIEDVRGDKYNTKQFQDDDKLYKFCPHEKHKILYRKTTQATTTTTTTTTTSAMTVTSVEKQIESEKSTSVVVLKEKNLNQTMQTKRTNDEMNVWSKIGLNYLNDLLKFDVKTLKSDLKLNADYLKYNCTHVNKHGVVIISHDNDLPSWLMQAMTTLVHWYDINNDTINNGKPTFGDVFNEIKNYFHCGHTHVSSDQGGVLLTNQLSSLMMSILKIFIEREQQQQQQQQQEDDIEEDDGCGSTSCCEQCLTTYDFVNTWLDTNAIEFNEFFLNLNKKQMTTCSNCNEPSIYVDDEDDDENGLAIHKNKKINRNNSFIAAMELSTSSKSLSKTQSMDFIAATSSVASSNSSISTKRRTPSFHITSNTTSSLNDLLQMVNKQQQHHFLSMNTLNTLVNNTLRIDSTSSTTTTTTTTSSTLRFDFTHDTFMSIISIFRVLLLYLPPIHKRKLHLLLRLLYKLKLSDNSRLLLNMNNSDDYGSYEFINDGFGSSSQQHYSIEDIEKILIDSFLKCLVKFNDNNNEEYQLAYKIIEILINNYSEVMRVPNDLLDLIQENEYNDANEDGDGGCGGGNDTSKQHLIKILYNILTNINMNQDERYKKLKQFKETYPQIYEEKYVTIKKAINILGLNETTNTNKIAKKRTLTNTTATITQQQQINNNTNNTTTINFPKFLLPKTLKKSK